MYNDCIPAYAVDNPVFLRSYLMNTGYKDSTILRQVDLSMILFNNTIDKQLLKKELNRNNSLAIKWIPEIRNVRISGIVRDKETKEPVSGIPVYVSVLFESPQIHINQTRSDGSFIFSLNNVESTKDIYLCPNNKTGRKLELLVNNDFSDEAVFIEYKTITAPASFPVVRYPDKENTERIPDFRNVLYWNPDLSLNKCDK